MPRLIHPYDEVVIDGREVLEREVVVESGLTASVPEIFFLISRNTDLPLKSDDTDDYLVSRRVS